MHSVEAQRTPRRNLSLQVPQDAHQAKRSMTTLGNPGRQRRRQTDRTPPVVITSTLPLTGNTAAGITCGNLCHRGRQRGGGRLSFGRGERSIAPFGSASPRNLPRPGLSSCRLRSRCFRFANYVCYNSRCGGCGRTTDFRCDRLARRRWSGGGGGSRWAS